MPHAGRDRQRLLRVRVRTVPLAGALAMPAFAKWYEGVPLGMSTIRAEYLHAHPHDALIFGDVRFRKESDEEEDEEEQDKGDESDSETGDEDGDEDSGYSV